MEDDDDFPLEKVMLGIEDVIRSEQIRKKIIEIKKTIKEDEIIIIKQEMVDCWVKPLSVRVAKKGDKLYEKEYIVS